MTFSTFGKAFIATALLTLMAGSVSALELAPLKPARAPLDIKKPQRATPKADLIVYLVDEDYGQLHLMRVTIRNNGKVKSDSAILSGMDMNQPAIKAQGSIPSIKPNGVYNVDLKFPTLPNKGDRIKLVADSGNHVDESNENNNVKFINY